MAHNEYLIQRARRMQQIAAGYWSLAQLNLESYRRNVIWGEMWRANQQWALYWEHSERAAHFYQESRWHLFDLLEEGAES